MSHQHGTVVLAYSGGLDTSVILHWLRHELQLDVIAYCADVGQGAELDTVRRRALEVGAYEVVIDDLRQTFASEVVLPAIQSQATWQRTYLLGTALARPVIARGQVLAARAGNATALAHGATAKGNDQLRFEFAYRALAPDLQVIAPWRTWPMTGRPELLAYARSHGIEVPATPARPYSTDANLVHVSYEGGVLEDPWAAPPEDMFQLTAHPRHAPEAGESVVVSFEAGVPVAIDGVRMSLVSLIEHANRLAGRNGVGRLDLVEDRVIGVKSRGVYETPGLTLLRHAYRAVRSVTTDARVIAQADAAGDELGAIAYEGRWFAPETRGLLQLISSTASSVSGDARLSLQRGSCEVTGRRSSTATYDAGLVSFDEPGSFVNADASGYIRLAGLRLAIAAEAVA